MIETHPIHSFPRLLEKTLIGFLIVLIAPALLAQTQREQVDTTLKAVVGLRTSVPDTARTVFSLGTEREGSGVVIGDDGLVLTIGYLIMEASNIEVTNSDGTYVPASMVAYDYDTGFGLVQAQQPLGLKGITLGNSATLETNDFALIISHVGPNYLQIVEVADIREFVGYWEYLLENAIFTTPPLSGFGGAALVNQNGELIGIGSLEVNDAVEGPTPVAGNMFVPIDLLKPIFDDLLDIGRSGDEQRPWLGVHTAMHRGHLFVTHVALDGPAEAASILPNDIIVAVNGQSISDMSEFLREVWRTGSAGVNVDLSIVREGVVRNVTIESGNRYDWLKLNPASGQSAMLDSR